MIVFVFVFFLVGKTHASINVGSCIITMCLCNGDEPMEIQNGASGIVQNLGIVLCGIII